jgi:hypothetical protein
MTTSGSFEVLAAALRVVLRLTALKLEARLVGFCLRALRSGVGRVGLGFRFSGRTERGVVISTMSETGRTCIEFKTSW